MTHLKLVGSSDVRVRNGATVSIETTANGKRHVDLRAWCPITDDVLAAERIELVSTTARERLVARLPEHCRVEAAAELLSLADELIVARQDPPRDPATRPLALERSAEERAADWTTCRPLAQDLKILDRFSESLHRLGLVGEDRVARLVFLSIVSRLLGRPVSVAVKGPSSSGKSIVVQRTAAHFPPSAYMARTGMSERALAYSEEPLSHRMLLIYEAAGLSGDFASYLVRTLLSEGRLSYETVEKTSDGLKAKLIEREGPTGLIVTTTAVNLHPENETRLLSVTVTDTPEQTRAVLAALAAPADISGDFKTWHALQRWLEGAERRVVIPYASALVDLIPPVAVRLRRDAATVLNLIRAHTILHQATREKDPDGPVLATLEDYAAVRELVVDLVSDAVDATVPKTMRETVAAVSEDLTTEVETTHSKVSRRLGLDKSAGRRRVEGAISRGYVRNLETGKGRMARLVLGDPLPDEVVILPTCEEVSQRVAGWQGGSGDKGTGTTEEDGSPW
jgi:hypothetical protein